jgi:hypothetical protein
LGGYLHCLFSPVSFFCKNARPCTFTLAGF